jgi:diguanylate cyclase (GGDEF)-like protein/PAS domain S-box-containing protein
MKITHHKLRVLLLLCLVATGVTLGCVINPILHILKFSAHQHVSANQATVITGIEKQHLRQTMYVSLQHTANREPGKLVLRQDIGNRGSNNFITLFSISAGALLLGGLLFGFFYFMLDKPRHSLSMSWRTLPERHAHHLEKHNVVAKLVILTIAIFMTEFLVMLLLLPANLPVAWSAIIDASILILILFPLLYLILIQPFTWQVHLRKQAESGNLLLGRILDHSVNEIYMFDTTQFHFVEVSQGACDNLGYTREELKHMTPLDLKVDYTLDQYRALIDPLRNGEKQLLTFETRHQRKDGTSYPVEVHLQLFENSSPPIFVAIAEDISERKRYIAELEHKALYDNLTELPNRSLLMDRLEHAIKVSRRDAAPLSVLLIDVMRLQEINDIMGHADGDLVLQKVAQRLLAVLRDSDTIARIGGDEFVIVLANAGYEHMGNVARKILSAFEELIYIRDMPLEVEVAIGIALYPDHGDTPATLLQHADVAMRVSKREASGFYLYTPEDDPFSVRHLQLHAELRHAIKEKTLTLYYQPKLDIKTGSITSVEALARWPHPDGVIEPNDFIPMVEQSGLIRPFTHWLLEEAMRQCRYWQERGIHLSIAANLSTRNLLDPDLADHLGKLLKVYKIDPACMTLEITESAVMSRAEKSLKLLTNLSAIGFKLSIDDFGTGYSSLAYLKRMPVNELKIDRSFVANMCTDVNDAMIVRSTIELAHNMGLQVVAEGIENQAQLDMLVQLGIDLGQGFYIARPLPQDDFITWLNDTTRSHINANKG